MRLPKQVVLILMTAVLLVIFVPLGLLESHRIPDWLAEVYRYVELSGNGPDGFRLGWVAEARGVDKFPHELLAAVPTDLTWEGIATIPSPARVRCLRLLSEKTGKPGAVKPASTTQLLVGYHDDGLYHSGWLVHELRGKEENGIMSQVFIQLGCDRWKKLTLTAE